MNNLILKNIIKRPGRSLALMVLAGFLSLSVFAGTMVVTSLRKGFSSLEERLGADIMVVPYEASTKSDLENIVLQGNTGYFYMDSKYLDQIKALEGVGKISAQYYLASVSAGCCSIPVQIIGFDPETDFSIKPWIKKSNGGEIGYLDVVVGNDLNAFVGDTLSFFGTQVRVAAKLDKTGTAYDTEVFTNKETIRTLIQASLDKKLNEYGNINSGNVISCILIRVADGYDVEDVLNPINIRFKKLKAVRTKNMISGISDSLAGVSRIAGLLTGLIWLISLGIMVVSYSMMTGERKKEFAVLRMIGASRKKLAGIVVGEGILISLTGSLAGLILGLIVILPFSGLIEQNLGLPFLLPGGGQIMLTGLLAVIAATLAGALTAGVQAYRMAKIDTGMILRSED